MIYMDRLIMQCICMEIRNLRGRHIKYDREYYEGDYIEDKCYKKIRSEY